MARNRTGSRPWPRAYLATFVCGAAALTGLGALASDLDGRGAGSPRREAPAGEAVAGPIAPRAAALPGAPGDLAFSTFLGGREWDEAAGVDTDRAGNTVVGGFTLSRDFPLIGDVSRRGAIVDGFVTKVSADRSRVLWSSKLGGKDLDTVMAVTVDNAGSVYVTGRTGSSDFPTAAPLQRSLKGRACTGEPCHDAFVAKLSSAGRLLWSTYFGGSGNEEGLGVAVDRRGSVYIAGITDSTDLPVRTPLQRTFQSLPCEGDLPCPYDAFVTKLSPNGGRVVYSTYLGGDATDVARSIAVDTSGSAYVVGSTSSPNFPKVRAFDASLHGRACGPPPGEPCPQAFLTKLAPGGGSARYSTLLGGRETDHGIAVAVDARGRAHVTGSTRSADFPTRAAAQRRLDNAACTSAQPEEFCADAFVTKFGSDGRALVYSTFLGGRAEDQGLGIAVSPGGTAVVGGRTDSTDFRSVGAAQPSFGGYIDGFATKLRPGGAITWSTFLGGQEADRATAVALDTRGAAHLVGRTLSPDLPTRAPTQPSLQDEDYDAFISVIK